MKKTKQNKTKQNKTKKQKTKKKNSQRVFALFKCICLKNQSLSIARWFYGKKCKIGKGTLYLTENQLGRNRVWCVEDSNSYLWVNMCISIFRFELEYQYFVKLPKISHIHKKIIIFKV